MPPEHVRQLEAFRANAPEFELRPEAVEDITVLFAGIDAYGAGWLLDMGLAEQRLLLDARSVPGEVLGGVRGPSTRRYLEEMRPGQTKMIDKLFSSPDGGASLGALVYGAFSAVAHGTTFGLTTSVEANAPNARRTPGVTWGAVYTSSRDVVSVLTSVILATEAAYRRRNELLGWAPQSWNETAGRAIQAANDSLPARETTTA
jgi:hypothetical protein